MLRSSLLTASAVLICASAPAQQQIQAQKLISPIRDAGTYHATTGTWTRGGGQANLGPDVVYRADAPSGYFGVGWDQAQGVDEGILPSASNGNFPGATVNGAYTIDGFEFGYCSTDATVMWDIIFYAGYTPCDDPDVPAFCLQNSGMGADDLVLPTASACWTVQVDLMGGAEICMETDGGTCAPGYQGEQSGLDHFGWGALWVQTGGGQTGPILAGGDPNWSDPGGGTCYNTLLNCSFGATGAGAQDLFGIGNPLNGCFFFGGYKNTNGCGGPSQGPGAQFQFLMYTDCSVDKGTCDSACGVVICDNTGIQFGEIAIDSCSLAASPTLTVSGLTGGQFSMVVVSFAASNSIFTNDSQGTELCLGGGGNAIGRYNKGADVVNLGGGDSRTLNLENNVTGGGGFGLPSPPGGTIQVGSTLFFQNWTRIGAGNSQFSKGIGATFEA